MSRSIAMIMAGGKGSRLAPLTVHRSKPAVPFGGRYRIIDFVLSNFVNSGYRKLYVLTQYMASSLIRHLSNNWRLSGMEEFIEVVPAQMRAGDHWYRGTADSVFQNINLIRDAGSDNVAVFGGDHIYIFAIDQMEDYHNKVGAHLTVATYPVPLRDAHQFGVVQVDEEGRIIGFQEKPEKPTPMPGRPDMCLVSMGNYFFRSDVLLDALNVMNEDPTSKHDFGKDVIPRLMAKGSPVYAYDFSTNRIPGDNTTEPFWADVGTLDTYFDVNMALRRRLPPINLYNRRWRIRTSRRDFPPARFVGFGGEADVQASDSMVCEGTIVSNSHLSRVLIGYDCFVHTSCFIEDTVIMSGCDIGPHSRLRKVLVDKNCVIEAGVVIGENPYADRERFPFITEGGIVVLPKGTTVPREGPLQFAHDQGQLMQQDPDTQERMAIFQENYLISGESRHSHTSAGPRYHKFSKK